MEDGRIHDRFRIIIKVTCKVLAFVIIKRYDQSGVGVLRSVIGEIIIGLDDGCIEGDRMHFRPSPELSLCKGLQVKAGDNAKIVPATAKSKIQIGVRVDVDVCDFAICEHDLTDVSRILRISR